MAVIEANEINLPELIDTEYALVDFCRENCGGCIYMDPFYRKAADEMSFIRFIRFDVDTWPKIIEQYEIKSLPTLIFFHKGQIVHRVEKGLNQEELDLHIAKMLYDESC